MQSDNEPDVTPSADRPKSPEDFRCWSKETTCGLIDRQAELWYMSGQSNLFMTLTGSTFVEELPRALADARVDYRRINDTELFALGSIPELAWNKKTFASVVDKLFRHNCLENENFPNPPESGWLSVHDVFSRIDDVVRTTLFVAYADGPKALAAQIENLARTHSLGVSTKQHAKEKGYYAHHVYVYFPVPIVSRVTGVFPEVQVAVEIQIATQLQGALREVTHVLYEKERLDGQDETNWKHDFDSGRFRAAYMAHSLRLIEAMIVDLRKTVTAEKKGTTK